MSKRAPLNSGMLFSFFCFSFLFFSCKNFFLDQDALCRRKSLVNWSFEWEYRESLFQVLRESIEELERFPQKSLLFGGVKLKAQSFRESLVDLEEVWQKCQTQICLQDAFEKRFEPYGTCVKREAFLTGYFFPLIELSHEKIEENFVYPVLKVPDDLLQIDLKKFRQKSTGKPLKGRVKENQVLPYWTREEIRSQDFSDQALAWTNDLIKLFFLEIQGSGLGRYQDGREIWLRYAGENGHPYFPIGRYFLSEGLVKPEDLSAEWIQNWLIKHPEKREFLLNQNPSYVFFELSEEAPKGNQGAFLTPLRSLAAHRKSVPHGLFVSLAWETHCSFGSQNRLMFVQDTGGGLGKDWGRFDVFWGFGKDAEICASRARDRGDFVVYLPVGIRTFGNQEES